MQGPNGSRVPEYYTLADEGFTTVWPAVGACEASGWDVAYSANGSHSLP